MLNIQKTPLLARSKKSTEVMKAFLIFVHSRAVTECGQ